MQTSPSWDLFIALFFIIGVSYGFMLQREKVVVTLLSVYAGLAIAHILTPIVQQFFVGDKTLFNSIFIKANTSAFTIQAAIFGLVIILLTIRSGLVGLRTRGFMSPIEVGIYSFLSTGLMLSSLISFMGDEQRVNLLGASKIAKLVFTHHEWWIVLPVIALVVFGRQRTSELE